jgi:molecular chaperone HscB
MPSEAPAGLPSLTSDYYEFLGIPATLNLDVEGLQRRFYELSRQLHPDRFSRRSPDEQKYSLDATAILNDAYRTLREPISRAEYVLSRAGLEIAEQRTKDVPPELLEEVFELNMALEEMRMGDEDARGPLEEAKGRFEGMLSDIDAQLQALFVKHDAGEANALADIRGVLNRRRYIQNLLRDVHQALQPKP